MLVHPRSWSEVLLGIRTVAIRHDENMISNGRLTQVGLSFKSGKYKPRYAVFECECGSRKLINTGNVKQGKTSSCGCYQKRITSEVSTTHGLSKNTASSCWYCMIDRCENRENDQYENYGGRGITVCSRWLNSLADFIEDMGDRPDGMSINRIDNSLGYFKENCRWATALEQSRNMRTNRLLEINGQIKCVAEWSEESGVKYTTVICRLNRGWTAENAVFTKPDTRFHHELRRE